MKIFINKIKYWIKILGKLNERKREQALVIFK